jgi:hypothetical protein
MTAALAAMNAEDFMIGTPAAPTALGVDYFIPPNRPDPGLLAKSRQTEDKELTLFELRLGWKREEESPCFVEQRQG